MNIRYATMADLDDIASVESECFPVLEAANCSSQKDNCATHKEWYHKLHLIARDFLLQKRMCFAHSRAERGRLRQIASSRECASPAHSAFIVTGNSIRISCYNKNNPRTTGEECEG